MKELKSIISAYKSASSLGQEAVLARVIQVSGSAYRRPGAAMLVIESGEVHGSVSGGCLEEDLKEHCLQLIKTGKNSRNTQTVADGESLQCIFQYDTSYDHDDILGSGSGCTGKITILAELLTANSHRNPLLLAEKLFSEQDRMRSNNYSCLATVTETQNCSELQASDLFQTGSNEVLSKGLHFVIESKTKTPTNQKSELRSFKLENRSGDSCFKLFLQALPQAKRLLIFGAGPDARPLAELASSLGMRVEVYDHRRAYVSKEKFPSANFVSHYKPEDKDSWPAIDEQCYCLAMAHNFLVDKSVVNSLLNSHAAYIGVLGPKKRTEKMLAQLKAQCPELFFSEPSEKSMQNLYAPAGLDIGAETAEEIAISIIAEIKAVANRREAGFLKNRRLPIHESSTSEPDKNAAEQLLMSQSEKSNNSARELRCRIQL